MTIIPVRAQMVLVRFQRDFFGFSTDHNEFLIYILWFLATTSNEDVQSTTESAPAFKRARK